MKNFTTTYNGQITTMVSSNWINHIEGIHIRFTNSFNIRLWNTSSTAMAAGLKLKGMAIEY